MDLVIYASILIHPALLNLVLKEVYLNRDLDFNNLAEDIIKKAGKNMVYIRYAADTISDQTVVRVILDKDPDKKSRHSTLEKIKSAVENQDNISIRTTDLLED